jgi:hypothetical protein
MPIGIQSHHMAGRLPTRAQEHPRCDDPGDHDREQQPAGDGAARDRSGGDGMKVGEQHGDQSSRRSCGPLASGVSIR